ncbi:MAG: hypothetical protein F7C33_01075 [Desulfurococcales archaeon]|nr:hypothetical protein [Desulfurococcales archaeon]
MAKILIAVSSIGLGHAARARVYGSLLEARGHTVEYYAPEPALSYLKAWGGRVIDESRGSPSLSVFLEEYWFRTGRALIGLRASLREHKAAVEAGMRLLRAGVFDRYDLVVAEESWEVISIAEHIRVRKAWISDFIAYKPIGLRTMPAAYAVNRFLYKRYKLFEALYYVGLASPMEMDWRMLPLGPRVSQVARERFHVVGPIPPVLGGELLDSVEARRSLGLPEGKLLLVQLGGTSAGAELVDRAVEASTGIGVTPIVITGPRAHVRVPRHAVVLGYEPRLPAYYRAFDCAYTLAGLLTITGLARAGVPGVLQPLPGHFEQEENAILASRKWRLFSKAPRKPGLLREALAEACDRGTSDGDDGLDANAYRLVDELEGLLAL